MKYSQLLIWFSFVAFIKTQSNELLSVVVIFRHGDRTPLHFYPNDPYKNKTYWPQGEGELTNEGIQRTYNLGKWLRERYGSLLPDYYSKDAIETYSTDDDRTLASAEAVLAGLYPPKTRQIWNKVLLWQPIPVHTAQKSIINNLFVCLKYDYLYSMLMISNDFRRINEKYKDLYAYISNYTGEIIESVMQVESISDTLFVESHNNLTLPNWTHGYFPEKIVPVENIFMSSLGYTDEMLRLTSGPFLYYTIKHFEKIISNYSTTKLLLYSGHDLNLATILMSMNAFNYRKPYYANAILFELYKNASDYFINVVYKDRDAATLLNIKNCSINCTLKNFENCLKNYTMSSLEWDRECFLP